MLMLTTLQRCRSLRMIKIVNFYYTFSAKRVNLRNGMLVRPANRTFDTRTKRKNCLKKWLYMRHQANTHTHQHTHIPFTSIHLLLRKWRSSDLPEKAPIQSSSKFVLRVKCIRARFLGSHVIALNSFALKIHATGRSALTAHTACTNTETYHGSFSDFPFFATFTHTRSRSHFTVAPIFVRICEGMRGSKSM